MALRSNEPHMFANACASNVSAAANVRSALTLDSGLFHVLPQIVVCWNEAKHLASSQLMSAYSNEWYQRLRFGRTKPNFRSAAGVGAMRC
jgi:hypothetical protein